MERTTQFQGSRIKKSLFKALTSERLNFNCFWSWVTLFKLQILRENVRLASLGPCAPPSAQWGLRAVHTGWELRHDYMAWWRGSSSKENGNIYQKKEEGLLGRQKQWMPFNNNSTHLYRTYCIIGVLITLYLVTFLILTTSLWGGFYYHPLL